MVGGPRQLVPFLEASTSTLVRGTLIRLMAAAQVVSGNRAPFPEVGRGLLEQAEVAGQGLLERVEEVRETTDSGSAP